MDFSSIERTPDAFQQPVEPDLIAAICRRAFGESCRVNSVKELDGGLYNNTYLVKIEGEPPLILRINPPTNRQYLSERHLMRNEYASAPFFAPIAPLIPKILMADFTHQLLDRDYMFYSFIEGEQWAQIRNELTGEEKTALWWQLGTISKRIHSVKGETFGRPYSNETFPTWSLALFDGFAAELKDFENVGLETAALLKVLDIARSHSRIFDEITQPSLLHGDLWVINLLVRRVDGQPKIVGVIDNDRTYWGDPLADWHIFILERSSKPEEAPFWDTYGQPERTRASEFRKLVYRAYHSGAVCLEQHRLVRPEAVKRINEEIAALAEELENFYL